MGPGIIGLIFMFACGPVPLRPSEPHGAVRDSHRVEHILEELKRKQQRITSFYGEANLKYFLPQGRWMVRHVRVVAVRGIGFHVWTLDGETPVDEFVCARGRLSVISKRNHCQLTDRCDRESIYRTLMLWIEPEGFLELVTGSAFAIAYSRSTIRSLGTGDRIEIALSDGAVRQQIVASRSAGDWRVLSTTTARGTSTSEVRYTHFSRIPSRGRETAHLLPLSAMIDPPEPRVPVNIHWGDTRTGIPITPELFAVSTVSPLPPCSPLPTRPAP